MFLVVGRQDNQWPENLLSLRPLLEAGQTLTSKLGSSETNIAYGDPLHWAAMVGLGLILLSRRRRHADRGAWLAQRRKQPVRTLADSLTALFAALAFACAAVASAVLLAIVGGDALARLARRSAGAFSPSRSAWSAPRAASSTTWSARCILIATALAGRRCRWPSALALVARRLPRATARLRALAHALPLRAQRRAVDPLRHLRPHRVRASFSAGENPGSPAAFCSAFMILPTVTVALSSGSKACREVPRSGRRAGLRAVADRLVGHPAAERWAAWSPARCSAWRARPARPRPSCSPRRSSPARRCRTASGKARCSRCPITSSSWPRTRSIRGRRQGLGRRARAAGARAVLSLLALPVRLRIHEEARHG